MATALSARKRFLFGAALTAVFGLSACVGLSAALLRSAAAGAWAEALALALFLLSLLLCLPVCALCDEYTRCTRPGKGLFQRLGRLRRAELRDMTAACPKGIRWALIGIAALALFQVLRLGHFEAAAGETGGFRIVGILAGATFFYSLSAPFLLAAAFMSGSYGAPAAVPRD
jgi:hypothetical protein